MKWQNNIFNVGFFGGFTNSTGVASSCAASKIDATGIITACWPSSTVSGNTIAPPMILRANPTIPAWPAGSCLLVGSGGGPYGGLTGLAALNALFVNYNNGLGGDYHVRTTSACHNSGNDGNDPGPAINTLLNFVAPVIAP